MRERFGPYQVIAELGRGGMGAVYKAFEPELNRHVAIKVMSEALAHDPVVVERFLREARAMAALSDPHIIQIYTIGTEEGQPYFAMEYIDGESLSARLKRDGRLPPAEALSILQQTAAGLASAHDRGVIHRDIKPGNLLINRRGLVKIADFGIALSTRDLSRKLTSTGEFVGTPGYLSPEVCLGKPVDARSDIFSLGIVFFEMLTGQIPFKEESPLGMMLEVVKAEIPDVRELGAEVDEAIAAILRRMIAKEPDDRFQDCHELASAVAAHPLLAGRSAPSATLRGTSAGAPAAATAAAQPTSVSIRHQAALQPDPLRDSRGALVRVAEPPPAARRRSLAPIAAVLGLVLAAGAVWAFREQIPFLKPQPSAKELAASPVAAEAPPRDPAPAAAPPATSPAAAAAPVAGGSGGTSLFDVLLGARPGTAPAEGPPGSASVAAAEPASATPATSEAGGATAAPKSAGSAPGLVAGVPDARVQGPGAEAPAGSGLGASEGQGAAPPIPAEAPASARPTAVAAGGAAATGRSRAAGADETRLARREALPPRSAPRLAVVAVGDPILTRPVEQSLTELLEGEGFELVDTELVPGLSGLRDAGGVDLAALMGRLKPHAELLVLVRAEPLGSQLLTYYGEASTLYSANLQLRAYSLAESRALGAGWREKVDFTTLNAEQQAAQAIRPHLASLLHALAPYRPARRG